MPGDHHYSCMSLKRLEWHSCIATWISHFLLKSIQLRLLSSM